MEQERIDYMLKSDFVFIASHYENKIRNYISKLQGENENIDVLSISRHLFYLQCLMDDFKFFGYPNIYAGLRKIFKEKFDSENILFELQQDSFYRGIKNLSDQQLIGENIYTLVDGKVYYRSFVGKWYLIDQKEAFFLLPRLDAIITDEAFINKLNSSYAPIELERKYLEWKNESCPGEISEAIIYQEGEITPLDYFNKVEGKIAYILQNPVSFQKINEIHGQGENFIENIFKVGEKLIEFVENLRRKKVDPIYLLRDGILFAEINRALDIIANKSETINQILINRKLLSKPGLDEYYWALSTDALFAALRASDGNFEKYYQVYAKELVKLETQNDGFKAMMEKLGNYLSQEVKPNGKRNFVIVDTGLQGSINMLTKYIIDNHTNLTDENIADIRMFVVGDWFRGVYTGRYESEYYPMMKDIEIFNRSEHLYKYKPGSLEDGKIKVIMGDKSGQLLANLELIILITLVRLKDKDARN